MSSVKRKSLSLKILAMTGALLVGFWLPLRLVGYVPSPVLEIEFDLLISLISAFHLRETFQQPGRNWRVASHWLKPAVLADLVTLVPMSLIVPLLTGRHADAWLLVNFFVLRHMRDIKPLLDHFPDIRPITYRLVPLLAILPPIVHLAACGWIAIGSGSAEPAPDRLTEYVRAVYWTLTTLCTVGYGDIVPKTNLQMIYAATIQLAGVGVFGYIMSNVASVLSRQDAAREHHMEGMDRIETFMSTHHVPADLRRRVRDYFHYLWNEKRGYVDRSLLEDLPAKLQSDLFLFMNREILAKVPFLKRACTELVEDLMRELEPRVAVPGERIFRQGDPGDALYFIQSGAVEVLGAGREVIATLSDGAFFGEMALVSDQPRSATVRSVAYCDLCLLSREAFDRVVRAYPEFREHLTEVARARDAA
jgi:voltage-gated potassium channel